jgi:uncharacterized protein YeaO (DUF488 family)
MDLWLKDVAPSPQLRAWFGHQVARWPDFQRRYRAELDGNPEVDQLLEVADQGPVTLLYAAKDNRHNHAIVLARYLNERRPD